MSKTASIPFLWLLVVLLITPRPWYGTRKAVFALQQQLQLPALEFDEATLSEQQLSVLQMATEGDPTALNAIGNALMQPSSTFGKRNVDFALQYFAAAATAGSTAALVSIGGIYAEGKWHNYIAEAAYMTALMLCCY